MLPISTIIARQSNVQSAPLKRIGLGIVGQFIDKEFAEIQIGTERITVKVPENSLSSGDNIRYRFENDTIILEKLSNPNQPKAAFDTFASHSFSKENIGSLTDSLVKQIDNGDPGFQIQRTLDSILSTLPVQSSKVNKTLINRMIEILQSELTEETKLELKSLLISLRTEITGNVQPSSLNKTVEIQDLKLPEGLYVIRKTDRDPAILSDTEIILEDLLNSKFANQDIRLIKTYPADRYTLAVPVSKDELMRELQSLSQRFSSRILQSIPIETYQKLLENRGSLDFQLFGKLDTLLSANQIQFSTKRAGSESAQATTVTQWLQTVLDNKSIIEETAKLIPGSASNIPSLIKQINSLTHQTPHLPLPEQLGITAEMIENSDNKADLIPSLIEKLGFTYEATLYNTSSSPKNNLKTLIYSLLVPVDFSIDTKNSIGLLNDLPDKIDNITTQLILAHNDQKVSDNLKNQFISLNETMTTIFSEATETIDSINNFINLKIRSSPIIQNPTMNSSDEKAKRILIKEFTKLTDLLQKTNPTESFLNEKSIVKIDNKISGPSLVQLLKNGISDILGNLNNELILSAEKLKNYASGMPPHSTINFETLDKVQQFIKQISNAIELTVAEIKEQKQTSAQSDQNAVLNKNTVQRNNQNFTNDEPNTAKSDNKETHEPFISANQPIKLAAESLLNRLESLQILAKQTATISGDQQILALPLNIGGQWTEVNVRFIKGHKSKKKQEQQNHFSVFLNVAPSKLGSISIKMDYERKKHLQLTFEFENNKTRKWFSEQQEPFKIAIKELGVSSIQMNLHSKHSKNDQTATASTSDSAFDLKI